MLLYFNYLKNICRVVNLKLIGGSSLINNLIELVSLKTIDLQDLEL